MRKTVGAKSMDPRETLAATDWMQGFQGKGNLKVRRSGSESAVSMWVGENAALVSRDTVTQTDLQPIFSFGSEQVLYL